MVENYKIETLSSLTLFRIVTSQIEASQFHNQNFSVNRYPQEVIDFSQGQTVIEFAERFQRELVIAAENNGDDTDDE